MPIGSQSCHRCQGGWITRRGPWKTPARPLRMRERTEEAGTVVDAMRLFWIGLVIGFACFLVGAVFGSWLERKLWGSL